MTANRDVGDISTAPGGKSGQEWTTGSRESTLALWGLNAGLLSNVAGTNVISGNVTVPTGFTAYSDGLRGEFIPTNSNTTACTLDLGPGAKPLVDPDGNALVANSIIADRITGFVFFAASDHFRLTTSAGTTNVTVQGGIILQRKAPSRMAAQTASSTSAEIVASQAIQTAYSTSRIVIEGVISAIVASGTADADGLTLELLVDGNVEETITDYLSPDQKQSTPFAFEYSPGDINNHTYAVRATATIASAYNASSTFIVCSEMSPNP